MSSKRDRDEVKRDLGDETIVDDNTEYPWGIPECSCVGSTAEECAEAQSLPTPTCHCECHFEGDDDA